MAPYLGLHLQLPTSKIITNFSIQSSSIQGESTKIEKIENYIKNLEEERKKIEVFKRELPLCIILLNDVICGMKDELENRRKTEEKNKVLEEEEFVPIKDKMEVGGKNWGKDGKDEKMNWMSSVQLWSDNNYSNENNNNNNNFNNNISNNKDSKKIAESEDESGHCLESFGGAFVPFKALKKEDANVIRGLPAFSPVSSTVTIVSGEPSKSIGRCHMSVNGDSQGSIQSPPQGLRKARRCWSPELHRMFVVALQQLGGAQVATPKQIRDLMKVDGLTNDEVKSHLQKYRLHARRVLDSPSPAIQSITLTGGLWPSREQQYTTTKQSASKSASPEGPLQLAVPSLRAISAGCDEDGKSEGYSWK